MQNKEMVGDAWPPTASMRTLKYFLEDSAKHDKVQASYEEQEF